MSEDRGPEACGVVVVIVERAIRQERARRGRLLPPRPSHGNNTSSLVGTATEGSLFLAAPLGLGRGGGLLTAGTVHIATPIHSSSYDGLGRLPSPLRPRLQGQREKDEAIKAVRMISKRIC